MMRSAPDSTRLDEQEQVFMVPGPREGMSLFLRRLGPSTGSARRAVLYIHGATFPSGLSIAHRFDCPSRIFGDTRFLASSGEFTAGVLPPASVSAVVLAGVADGQVHR
jgi:hypothetical protein